MQWLLYSSIASLLTKSTHSRSGFFPLKSSEHSCPWLGSSCSTMPIHNICTPLPFPNSLRKHFIVALPLASPSLGSPAQLDHIVTPLSCPLSSIRWRCARNVSIKPLWRVEPPTLPPFPHSLHVPHRFSCPAYSSFRPPPAACRLSQPGLARANAGTRHPVLLLRLG